MPLAGPLYPVNLILKGRPVLVVGGGSVAAAKARGLVAAEAVVHVVALEVRDEIRAMPLTWEERAYERGEVASYRYAVAATDVRDVNQAVFDDGEAAGIFVNAADDPDRCSASLPARLDRGSLVVTVSTSGRSPAMTVWLRDRPRARGAALPAGRREDGAGCGRARGADGELAAGARFGDA